MSNKLKTGNHLQKNMEYCEDTLPPLSYLDYQSDEKRPSLRDRDRLVNDPHWAPGFLNCCSWIFREQVRTCGFRRNSLSLDRAPKIRDSVLLKSLENFLVTLPSISSETWEMYSWAIAGSSVFCDWLFLVFSGVSIETAAIFLLFLKVAMTLKEKFCQQWRLNWSFLF